MCTASYAAPEMWGSESDDDDESKIGTVYGYQVDAWSIGCVLFECAFLKVFAAGSNSEKRLRTVAKRIGKPPEMIARALAEVGLSSVDQASAEQAEAEEQYWASGGDLARWLRDKVLAWDHQDRLTAKCMVVELERRRAQDDGGAARARFT